MNNNQLENKSATEEANADLSADELTKINYRLSLLLDRFDALPYHAVLYRLGEVASNRIEQKKLRRSLAELTNNRRPRQGQVPLAGPWEGARRIYVGYNASHDEAVNSANGVLPALRELAALCDIEVLQRLSDIIADKLKIRESKQKPPEEQSHDLGGDVRQRIGARILEKRSRRGPRGVSLLILHEPDWLYPEDERLWQFLLNCNRDDSAAVIVARAIAPGTFPFLRAVGAVGLQYYSTLVAAKQQSDGPQLRDTLGWSHIRHVDSIAAHPILKHLRTTISRVSQEESSSDVRKSLNQAESGRMEDKPTISRILEWWRASPLPLPPKVARGWRRWCKWDEYIRLDEDDQQLAAPHRLGSGTKVIPLGLPLSRREVRAILEAKHSLLRKNAQITESESNGSD